MKATSFILTLLLFTLVTVSAQAAVKSETVEYKDGETALRGYLYWDDAVEGKRPGVLVVHEWWGLDDHARQRAEKLAALGYVAFATDMYGAGQVTEHAQKAGEWAQQITANLEAWRARAELGLAQLKEHPKVDAARLAAIGYCFGGSTVMQLAYGGADLHGVVSFHGSLPLAEEPPDIKAQILVAHGADDPFVDAAHLDKFIQGLKDAGAKWQVNIYSGARHSFTNPDAGSHGMDALAYDATADRRSWAAMELFFEEIFGP